MPIFDERFYNKSCGCCGNQSYCRTKDYWCDEAQHDRYDAQRMPEAEKQRLRDAHFCVVDCSTDNEGRNILP